MSVRVYCVDSLYHQELVHYPSTKVHTLEQRLLKLETDLLQLSRAFATKSDVRALRDGVDVPLSQLSKAVKRFDRKEEYFRLTLEEKFGLMEQKVQELVQVGMRQQEVLEGLEQENEVFRNTIAKRGNSSLEFANFLGRLLGSITTTSTNTSYDSTQIKNGKRKRGVVGTTSSSRSWYEKGLNWYLFWPVTVPKSVLGWVVEKTGKTVRGIEQGFVQEIQEEAQEGGLRGLSHSATTSSAGTKYSSSTRKKSTTNTPNALKA